MGADRDLLVIMGIPLVLFAIVWVMIAFGGAETSCPEGETFQMGAPIYITNSDGIMIPTYPFAGCK